MLADLEEIFEGLVPKTMNQYLIFNHSNIYFGMNEPAWKVADHGWTLGRRRGLLQGLLDRIYIYIPVFIFFAKQ